MNNIGKAAYTLRADGKSTGEVARILEISERTVRRQASLHAQEYGLLWPLDINQHSRLTNRYQQRDSGITLDRDEWHSYLNTYSSDLLKVAILNDIHFPDEDPLALNVVADVLEDLQPQVIIDGSDVFDFPTVSRFESATEERAQDVWGPPKRSYLEWRFRLKELVPGHKSIFIMGNHDHRLVTWAKHHAPQLAQTIGEEFITTIRSTGTFWMGWDYDMCVIDRLLILHGVSAGRQPAAALWRKTGFNYDVSVAGHVHRKNSYEQSAPMMLEDGTYFQKTRSAHTTGCLCKLRPHYSAGLLGQDWSLGSGIATIDRVTGNAYYESLDIDPKTYTTVFGSKIYRSN